MLRLSCIRIIKMKDTNSDYEIIVMKAAVCSTFHHGKSWSMLVIVGKRLQLIALEKLSDSLGELLANVGICRKITELCFDIPMMVNDGNC